MGANKEMRAYIAEWNEQVIEERLLQEEITWKLYPPATTHFGVVWGWFSP